MFERGIDEAIEGLGRVFADGPFLDRRLGRALTFQALYEMDMGHHAPDSVLDRIRNAATAEAASGPYTAEVLRDATAYARTLIDGVLGHQHAIDDVIQRRAPLWPLAQMSAVDRNVLRIGLYESLYGNATVPLRTAINEAVELAKLFGSETSAKFVNGVLGRAVEANANADVAPNDSSPAGQRPAPTISDRGSSVHADPAASTMPHDDNTTDSDTSLGLPERGTRTEMATTAEERLKKIIAEQLSVSEDEVTPEANFIDDLNADSLDLVELIMSLEEEFNVKISDEDAEKIRTVQDAMDYLHEHGGA